MSSRTLERVTLGVILGFAFFLRMWDLGRNGLWYDEILQAQAVVGTSQEFIDQLIVHAAMPLDYVIERGVLTLGTNELLLRFSSAAFSTLAVAVMYKLARAMFGHTTGIFAAAFLAVSSFAVFYAHEARPYSLYMLLVLAAMHWLYRALQTNKLTHWFYFGVCVAGAVLTHLFALFVVLALIIFLVLGLGVRVIAPRRAQLFSRITRRAILAGILVAALFLAALWLTPNAQFVWGSSLRFFAFLFSPQFLPPEKWYGLAPGETPPLLTFDFFYAKILENFSGGGIFPTVAFIGLGLLGLTKFPHKPWEIFLLTVWALLPSTFIILFLGSRGTLFATRYLIASLPAWLVLCAVGVVRCGALLQFITRKDNFIPRAAMLLLAFLFIAFSLERTSVVIAAPKEEWRTVGKILTANVHPNDAVITLGGTPVVYFYAHAVASQKYTAELGPQIAEAENHSARVWLVFNRYVFDPGGEIQAWLDTRGALALRADSGITLYYWRAGANNAALRADAQHFQLPASAFVYTSLAEQFARDDDWASASNDFAQALSYAQSTHETAMVNLAWGEALRRAEQLENAAEKYRAALAVDEKQIAAWNGLGRVYLEQYQLDAAHDALRRALALDAQSYAALYFLANYYERIGDETNAQVYYARAAEIIPELVTPP